MTKSRVFAPALPNCRLQKAFVPQTMSATVFVLAPLQIAGPMFVAGPQSLSVTRMTAFAATIMAQALPHPVSTNSKTRRSPWSSAFAKPVLALIVADDETGLTVSGGAPPVTVTGT